MLSTGLCVQLACIWEATARKPGNVHRTRDFADVGYVDFLLSAAAVAPVFEQAVERGVGETIVAAVRATRRVVTTNTNLGIVLLLAPLTAVPGDEDLRVGVERVLNSLTVADARAAYEAIRLADPGGLGAVPDQDVQAEPTQTLRQVMSLAANRDLIARQYADGFREVFDAGVPALTRGLEQTASLEGAIIWCQLELLTAHADSLIARKRGLAEAAEASRRARRVRDAGWPCRAERDDFDAWLSQAGHARNPGATADLVAAALFVALRQDTITLPSRWPWTVDG